MDAVHQFDSLIVYEPAVLVGEYRERASLASQMESVLDEGDERQAMKYYVREVMHGGAIDDLDGWLADWPAWPDIVSLAENIVRINYAIEQYRLPASLDIESPALLLEGAHGPQHLKDGLDAVETALSKSRRVEFDGIGPGGPGEAPDRVTTIVRRFIEEDTVDVSRP
jgi:pimeloyl-ACP methyl ester carboxylesterase